MATLQQTLTQPQLTPDAMDSYRSFVIKKHPNLSTQQIKKLDEFVDKKKKQLYTQYVSQAAKQGLFENTNVQKALQYGGVETLPGLLQMQQQGTLPKTPLTEKEETSQKSLNNLEQIAMQIKTLAESGKNVSGKFTGKYKERLAGAREIAPIIPGQQFIQNVDQMRSLASQLAAEIAFGEGGKQFTETERALLAGQIPLLGVETNAPRSLTNLYGILGVPKEHISGEVIDTEEELINKMNELLKMIQRKRTTGTAVLLQDLVEQ